MSPLTEPAATIAFPQAPMDAPVVAERATPASRASLRAIAMEQIETYRPLATQFGKFVDNAFVYTAHYKFGIGLILAGILSFFVAGSSNWLLNRLWTFRGVSKGRLHYEWMRYLASNAAGFILNRGIYIALITTSVLCRHHPILALAAGSIGGLGVNFAMSRRIVFR
jgi:putative flippase GtrA